MRVAPAPLVARITSGLGNQLFQYAAAFSECARSGRSLEVDTSWYDFFQIHKPLRTYRLAKLGLADSGRESASGFTRWIQGLAAANQPATRKLLQSVFRVLRTQFVNEQRPFVDSGEWNELAISQRIVMNGYWQVAARALPAVEEIRRVSFGKWTFSRGALEWRDRIDSVTAVFVHVRRGDYLTFGLPLLDQSYFEHSASEFLRLEPRVEFFVFSEDLKWTRENLNLPGRVHFVTYRSDDADIEDLLLMASCAGGIVANSSFSWWAASLSRNRLPIIAPDEWTIPFRDVPPALYPSTWRVFPSRT